MCERMEDNGGCTQSANLISDGKSWLKTCRKFRQSTKLVPYMRKTVLKEILVMRTPYSKINQKQKEKNQQINCFNNVNKLLGHFIFICTK